jgi:antitoxin CcdA
MTVEYVLLFPSMRILYAHYQYREFSMQPQLFGLSSAKKSVNLTANARLIASAKEKKINLSEVFEEALLIRLRALQQQEWLEQNRDGIAAYNERIERSGIFASKYRSF